MNDETSLISGPLSAAATLTAAARDNRSLNERVQNLESEVRLQHERHIQLNELLHELKLALSANTAATSELKLMLAGRRECPNPGLCLSMEPRLSKLESTIGRLAFSIISISLLGVILAGWEFLKTKLK